MRSYVSGYVCPVSCRSCYSLTAKIFWFLSQESPRLARSSSSSVNNPQSLWFPLLSSLSGLPINSEAEDLNCSPNSKFLYSSSPYPSLDYGTFFQFYFWNLNVPSLKHPIFNSYIKHPFILRIILTVDSLEIYFWISFLCTIHCFCVSPISAWNPHSGAEVLRLSDTLAFPQFKNEWRTQELYTECEKVTSERDDATGPAAKDI